MTTPHDSDQTDDLVTATHEFISDMRLLLSPQRVAAIWANQPDPWENRK